MSKRMAAAIWVAAVFFSGVQPAQALGEAKPVKLLALGDSTTAGTPDYRSPLEAPPAGEGNAESQYAYWIKKKHRSWTIINHGIAGQRSDEIYERFKDEDGNFDGVIVLAGVNDLYQGYDVAYIETRLEAIYDLAVKKNMRVMACTIIPYNVSTSEVKTRMDEVNAWIRTHSAERGFLFCDTYAVVNDPQNPGNLADTRDRLHPTVKGYRKMGEAIEKVLTESAAFSE